MAARFVHRRGVEVLRVQPQRLFAGVGDAHRTVVVAFFEFGEGDGFAVDGHGGVGGEFGRDGGQAHQPGEFLRAEVAVMRQRPRQRFALLRVLFADGVGGVVRVVLYVLPQGLQLGKADEVVRGKADAAAVGVAVAVFFFGYAAKALACRLVFAEERQRGGDVEAVVAVEFVARIAVVVQQVAAYGFAGVGEGVVSVAVVVGAVAAVAAVGVRAQVL